MQALLGRGEVGLGLRQLPFRGNERGLQLGLLLFEHVERNRVRPGQVVADQAATLGFDLLDFAAALLGVLALVLGEQPELLDQLRLDRGYAVGELRDLPPVVGGHFLLHPLGGEIGQGAAGAPVAPGTHEVVVGTTVAGDLGEQQPLAAERAEDRSLDVVVVPPGAVAALGTAIEDLLNPLPKLVRDKLGVRPFVFDTLPNDHALEIGVAEEAVQRPASDLAGCPPARIASQAALVQLLDQPAQRPLARGECLEGVLHVVGAVGVKHDVADGVPAFHSLLVEVAELGPGWGAAKFGLLAKPVFDLDGVVTGTVGVEYGQHPHIHQPGRAAVDYLGRRHQLRSRRLEFSVRLKLGQLVADESIQRIDDEVVDLPVLFDEIERFAKRPVHAV